MVNLKGTRCFLTQFSGSELALTHHSWSPVSVTCAWSVMTSPSCPNLVAFHRGALVVGLGQAVDGPRPSCGWASALVKHLKPQGMGAGGVTRGKREGPEGYSSGRCGGLNETTMNNNAQLLLPMVWQVQGC